MEYNNLLELIKTISESNITNFKYEEGNLKIHMSTCDVPTEIVTINTLENVKTNETVNVPVATVDNTVKINNTESVSNVMNTSNTVSTPVAAKEEIKGKVVTSPLVGTFYTSPSEDGEPFVKIGDTVKQGQTLAIVEAMKLMNEIESDETGVIAEIYVTNGESVEYGQPLFLIQ